MDCSKWRKLIDDVWWSGWVWVDECFFWYRPTRVVPPVKPVCVLCTDYIHDHHMMHLSVCLCMRVSSPAEIFSSCLAVDFSLFLVLLLVFRPLWACHQVTNTTGLSQPAKVWDRSRWWGRCLSLARTLASVSDLAIVMGLRPRVCPWGSRQNLTSRPRPENGL